ncbi:hypothetical protein [Pseudomonas sp. GV071]|uniref:hypothetical protein n=1 Tax=Pseudomonas sp. GV071 TaxID=2135754 RepID=UPI000D3A5D54|nr:hypothetical protein [Pseudomonas sp. GV071]PTQ70348.1 hypothetical protein C8K61_10670 [Pseudomonas sp. GV071]
MALGDERRASGRTNAAERQAIGKNNAAERRAIQTNNTNERRGSSIQDDLNSLIRPEKQAAQLRTVEPRGSLPAQRGSAPYVAPKSAATGGGIASPLVEPTATTREYFPSAMIPTTDGLAWARFKSVKKVNMTDANGAEVVFEYKNALE